MPFDGLTVLSLETRKATDMEKLIARHGGVPLVVPSVRERPLAEHTAVDDLLAAFEAQSIDMLVCMTGAGLSFLREVVEARGELGRLVDGLKGCTIVARGPKPVPVLRALGAPVHVLVSEPNTWREIVAKVSGRAERRIAVLEYGRPNEELTLALERNGATVTPVPIYRWDLPEDTGPLRAAAHALVRREPAVVLFTSSIQLEHLLRIAAEEGIEAQVRGSLSLDTVVASIGPVMNDALRSAGLEPDIVPEHPKMGALVKSAAERWRACVKSQTAILPAAPGVRG